MAKPHIPSIAALKAVEDPEVAFYAAVGAVMSLAAGLELSYFRVFYQASGMAETTAATVFYEVRNASTRRDMANAAIKPMLSDAGRAEWLDIYGRIKKVTGNAGHRNLLGHSRISREEAIDGAFDPDAFDDSSFDTGSEERFFVAQDEIQVLAGKQRPRQENFESLLRYCREVITLLSDIDSFMSAYESGGLRGE